MKRLRLLFILVLTLTLSALIFSSCDGGGGGSSTVRVMVGVGDGFTVIGDNPVDVAPGTEVSFRLEIEPGYLFDSVSVGEYDEESGELYLGRVTKRTLVEFNVIKADYDTTKKYFLDLKGMDGDTMRPARGTMYTAGTRVTVRAGYTGAAFAGWSFGKSYEDGGRIVSGEREFTFRITPDGATGEFFTVYANYLNSNLLVYDPNGGSINRSAESFSGDYVSAAVKGGRLSMTYSAEYTDYCESLPILWNDGTFTRDGYILREFNTRPDASGTSYGPGSKIFADDGGRTMTLYCIWERANEGDFTYEAITLPLPKETEQKYLPHWNTSGVAITGYTGAGGTVAIPETIDGKPVTAIRAGAFRGVNMETLVLPRTLLVVERGAFTGCTSLETLYYPDSIYEIYNDSFDDVSFSSVRRFLVSATMAPRYAHQVDGGAFAIKLSRVLAHQRDKKLIMVSGSSSYQGFGTEYLAALLDGEYTVINFGTTRTTNGGLYLEALRDFTATGDIVLFAPENSAYMFGERELYWKTLRDIECMYNILWHVDISNYTNVLGAFSDFNMHYRYTAAPRDYTDVVKAGISNGTYYMTKYGDFQNVNRAQYCREDKYIDAYIVTMNERVRSRFDGSWNDVTEQEKHRDYNDPNDNTWCSVSDAYYRDELNRVIRELKRSGAKVYFTFCPVDGSKIVAEGQGRVWLSAYDRFISETYEFDGVLGRSADYVFAHEYFYDCAFHTNDYGRTYRTYRVYLDLCDLLGRDVRHKMDTSLGTFAGCLFEMGGESGVPAIPVDYLKEDE